MKKKKNKQKYIWNEPVFGRMMDLGLKDSKLGEGTITIRVNMKPMKGMSGAGIRLTKKRKKKSKNGKK